MLKPKDWGYSNMDALIRALGDVIEVSNNLFSPLYILKVARLDFLGLIPPNFEH